MPDQSDIVSHGRRNTSLCSALLVKAGLKPSLATTTVKASERVIEGPLAWRKRERRGNDLFSALRKKRGNGVGLASMTVKVSERVISNCLGHIFRPISPQ